MKHRTIAGALAAVIGAGVLSVGAAQPAQARSEDAWRVGAYAGAAGVAYGVARGNPGLALVSAGLGLLSYSQWQHEMRRRHFREWRYVDYCDYRDAWYRHHRPRYYPARYEVVHYYPARYHRYHRYYHHGYWR